jgi:hypothetical protein
MTRRVLAALALAVAAWGAQAAEDPDPRGAQAAEDPGPLGAQAADGDGASAARCRAGSFVREGVPLRIGVVRVKNGEARPNLLADDGGCPVDRGLSCRIGSALGPGESVIVSYGFRQFVCTARTAEGGVKSVGWLPRRSVRTSNVDQAPPLEDWPGDWVGAAGSLVIRPAAAAGLLEVEGAASSEEGARGDVAAWVNGAGRPDGQQLAISDEFGSGCSVSLRLVGALIFASEVSPCGAGASFDGVYTRRIVAP